MTSKKIQIILTQDVPKLGRKSEVKEVAAGFARNFLFPKNLAIIATAGNMEKMKQGTQQKQDMTQVDQALLKPLLEKFETEGIELQRTASKNGKLFGSVSAEDIIEAVSKKFHCSLDKKHILLEKPIKECGDHQIRIKVNSGIPGKVKVVISPT